MRKWKREIAALEKQIADVRPEVKKEEGEESPGGWILCEGGGRSKPYLTNSAEQIEQLLKDVKTALNELLPSGGRSFGRNHGNRK